LKNSYQILKIPTFHLLIEREVTQIQPGKTCYFMLTETPVVPPKDSLAAEAAGIVFPWLQWETTNDLQT
jgi:hypothetical protein